MQLFKDQQQILRGRKKIVSHTVKNLAVNPFIELRIHEHQDLFDFANTFGALDNYRNALNRVQATANFMYNMS